MTRGGSDWVHTNNPPRAWIEIILELRHVSKGRPGARLAFQPIVYAEMCSRARFGSGDNQPAFAVTTAHVALLPDQRPATAGNGRAFAVRSALSRSASRNARSIDCSALSRGSQTVW